MFEYYLMRWNLIPDGEPILTPSSRLLPVRYQEIPAMLKIACVDEERRGNLLMQWWNGEGAAPVFDLEGDALLMERAESDASLIYMAQNGLDDEASHILCDVAARLHAKRDKKLPQLISLVQWFKALEAAALRYDGVFRTAAITAHELLNEPQDEVVLHGDIHHGNVLKFGAHDWLAIDPKGLIGERAFDYANIFCNPSLEVVTQSGRLMRQLNIIAEAAKLDQTRLLKWVLAYAGLSAAWTLEEGKKPQIAISVAKLAIKELGVG